MNPTLDKYLRNVDSPAARNRGRMSGVEFDRSFNVQTRRVKASQSATENMVQISPIAVAAGTFGTGTSVTVETNLTPDNNFSRARILSMPYMAVYEGTAAVQANQIFPSLGANIAVTDYETSAGFDYGSFDEFIESYKVNISNLAAGDVSIYAITRWKYISERSGTAG